MNTLQFTDQELLTLKNLLQRGLEDANEEIANPEINDRCNVRWKRSVEAELENIKSMRLKI